MSIPHRAVQDLLAHVHDVPEDPGSLGSDDEAAALIRSAATMGRPDELVRRLVRLEVNEVYDVTVVLPESASPQEVHDEAVRVLAATEDEERTLVDRGVNLWSEEL
jgi:hypothetical protein